MCCRQDYTLRIVTGLFAIFLAGCSDRIYTASKDITLSKDSETAVIVIGLRKNAGNPGNVSMTWRKIDQAKGYFSTTFGPGMKISRFNSSLLPNEGFALDKTRYFVKEIDAGQHALHFYAVSIPNIYYRTNVTPNTYAFNVEGGKVTYVGDFIIETPIYTSTSNGKEQSVAAYRESKIRFEGHNKSDVEAFLKSEYKNLPSAVALEYTAPFELKTP